MYHIKIVGPVCGGGAACICNNSHVDLIAHQNVSNIQILEQPIYDSLPPNKDVIDHLRTSGLQSTIHTLSHHMNVLNLEEVTPKGIQYSINNVDMEHKHHLKRKSRVGGDDRLMNFLKSKFVFPKPRKIIKTSAENKIFDSKEEVYKNVAESLAKEVFSLKLEKKKKYQCNKQNRSGKNSNSS